MTDAPELKPCPFCGGEANIYGDDNDRRKDFVMCCVCQSKTDSYTIERAIAAWNTRADLSADRLAAAEKLVDEMQTLILCLGRSAIPQRIHDALAAWEASKCGD